MKTNWAASVVAALVSIATIFATPLQALIASHPSLAALLGGASVIIAHLLPSPLAAPPTGK
jgi:hypothetical protein